MKIIIRLCTSALLISPRSSIRLYSTRITMKKDNNFMGDKQIPQYKPKNDNQHTYYNYLNDPSSKIVFAIGPAGTGKTLLACNSAVKHLKNGTFDKIVITRPVVSVEEEQMGFLPGNIVDKMDPWTRPIFDIFSEFYTHMEIQKMIQTNVIEISPLAYMRGRTFKNAFIIADEMQNSSPNQMLMLITRIGFGSKMVITGDLKQSDKLDKGKESGLADFITRYKSYNKISNGIKLVELKNSDIERNPIIITLLDIYDNTHNITQQIITNTDSNKNITTQCSNISQDAALIPIEHMSRIHNLLPSTTTFRKF